MKIAIDGCGDLSTRTVLPHLRQPDAVESMEVVAVCDIVGARAKALADEYGIPSWFDDFDELLAKSDAEAVLILVPGRLHFEHALRAVLSNRHVYVQKPFTNSVVEADELLAAVAAKKVKLVAAPGQALWPLYHQIRALIQDGAIGEPYHALGPTIGWEGRVLHHDTDPTWHFSAGAGPLRDHGVYGIQTLTTILGPVSRVGAFTRIRVPERLWNGNLIPVTEPDNTILMLDFASGAFGNLAEAWCHGSPASATFRINGLEGVIEGGAEFAGYPSIFPLSCTLYRSGREPEVIQANLATVPFLEHEHPRLHNPHIYADIQHLVHCIENNTEPLASGSQARHTVDILETAYAAAQAGRALDVASSGLPFL